MTRVVRNDFRARLQAIVRPLARRYRRRARRDVESVLRTGASSPADLLTVLKDERARTTLLIKVCWILSRLGDKRAVPAFMAALKNPDARVRQAAAQSLGDLESRRALRALVPALRDEDVHVRRAAVYALGSIRDVRAFRPLVRTLNNRNEDPGVRGMAAEALAGLSHRRAPDVLIAALSDAAAEVRFWAAFGLGQLRSSRALPKLKRLAATDHARLPRWGSVRKEAAKAVKYIERR